MNIKKVLDFILNTGVLELFKLIVLGYNSNMYNDCVTSRYQEGKFNIIIHMHSYGKKFIHQKSVEKKGYKRVKNDCTKEIDGIKNILLFISRI